MGAVCYVRFFALAMVFCHLTCACTAPRQRAPPKNRFPGLAFYTAKQDLAHISFVQEANTWFAGIAEKKHFKYNSTDNGTGSTWIP